VPVIEVHLSERTVWYIKPSQRDLLGDEWRQIVHEVIGVPLEEVAVLWEVFFDAQNPIPGPELWVFYGTGPSQESAQVLKQNLKTRFNDWITQTAHIPGMQVGVWLLPQPDSDFILGRAGS
jgi:hypothetical protein